jgi:hypothetical protein
MQDPLIDLKRNAEATRYALLRRLAPAIRHQMAGNFQPVTMMVALIEKRLLAATPNLPALVKTAGEVRAQTAAATRSNLDLLAWIAPDPKARVALGKGIQDALHLVATELSFRGFKIVNQTEGLAAEVALHHVRGVFVASLLALTDAAASPANVLLAAALEDQNMVVTMALETVEIADAATGPSDDFHIGWAGYRKLEWEDVAAIATADGVAFTHTATTVELCLPI